MSQHTSFDRHVESIETELKSAVMGRGDLALYRMMAQHMGWVDELGEPVETRPDLRVHPTLCVMVCEALGGEPAQALPAAAAVELVLRSSQVHGDIQNGVPERNGRPTVWWTWGPAQSINAGDGMHALARLSLLRLADEGLTPERAFRAVSTLDAAALRYCEGQFLDLTYQDRVDITEEAYFEALESRWAALLGCAAELGAQMASAGEGAEQAMALYGRKLGAASHVRDDVMRLWGSAFELMPQAGDLLNKRKSLPIVYALRNATGAERRTLGDVYFKRVMEPEDLDRILEVLERLGAREFAQEKADALCREAIEALNDAGVSAQGLEELASYARYLSAGDS
ncbi:MAG: polyprenyl synthetase family protein [Chloroflexota bacterium]|nr:polyprenyl synthetase family protein [Chloroflexota bacterium]MDE2940888.1 polyprenyl synthetase family protein [Chloroflexota bacterium]MDE3268411.1 polyprenyl synthetase family protein [Chloroflexota bacterium]